MQPTTESQVAIDGLNTLLRGELAAVETYRQALGRIKDASLRPTVEENLRLHEQRLALLRSRILQMGGTPDVSSGAWGAFARLVEAGAKALGTTAAIDALEEGEDHGLKLYRNSMGKLDAETRQIVETELFPAQEQTHRSLSALKHRLH